MKMAFFVPFALAAALMIPITALVLPYNDTESMPLGFYLRLPAWNVEEGDLVQAENPMQPGWLGVMTDDNLLKRVASISPEGLYELQGDHPYSFDSTFFGLVGRERIRAELIPVLSFD